MSNTLQRATIVAACCVALPAWSDAIFTNELLVPNSATWDFANPNPATTLFAWGDINGAPMGERTLVYTGTKQLRLTSIQFFGTPQDTFGASGGLSQYTDANGTTLRDIGFRLSLSNDSYAKVFADFVSDSFTLINNPTTLVGDVVPLGGANLDRMIDKDTTFKFSFYSDWNPSATAPTAVLNDFSVTIQGEEVVPVLSVSPTALAFTGRAGTGQVTPAGTVTVSNTGAAGTTLSVDAGAATGASNFSGGGTTFDLFRADVEPLPPPPTQDVNYAFTPRSTLGTSKVAVTDDGSATIKGYQGTTEVGSQAVTLTGDTVGPVFEVSGQGVSGNTVTFGNVLITKNGSQGPQTNGLTVTNSFSDPDGKYVDTLTGLTVNNVTGTSGTPFAGSGKPTTAVIADNGGSQNFNAVFNPTSGSAGGTPYQTTATFQTDVNAPDGLGRTGDSYNYTYRGTAYAATLSVNPEPLSFTGADAVRIGGDAQTKTITVTNETGGGFAMHGVTSQLTGMSPGADASGFGTVGTGTIDSASAAPNNVATQTLSVRALNTLAALTTAQDLAGQYSIVSTEAPTLTGHLAAKAVGPVFQLSEGGTVLAPGSDIDFGNVLVTKSGGAVTRNLTVTNRFNSEGVGYSLAQTGLDINAAPITGTGQSAYGRTLPSGPIADDSNTGAAAITFDATATATAAGQTYNAAIQYQTDVKAAALGDGEDYTYNLKGTAYKATLSLSAQPVDFGSVRIGGNAETRAITVTNDTGGGFAMTGVNSAVTPGSVTPGGLVGGFGTVGTGTIASASQAPNNTATQSLSFGAAASLAGAKTAQTLTAGYRIESADAPNVFGIMTVSAVGPAFDMTGSEVSGGVINLGNIDPGTAKTSQTLTIANLFGADLDDLTDLTIRTVGLGGSEPALFSLNLPTSLPAVLRANSLERFVYSFTFLGSMTPGLHTAVLTISTDQGAAFSGNGTPFTYTLMANVTGTAPLPPSLALLGLGLAALGASRRHARTH